MTEWIVFYAPSGKELLAITREGLFEGEIESTIDLLAYEHGLNPSEISFAQVTRKR